MKEISKKDNKIWNNSNSIMKQYKKLLKKLKTKIINHSLLNKEVLALKIYKMPKIAIENLKNHKIKLLTIKIKINKKIGYLKCNKKHKN